LNEGSALSKQELGEWVKDKMAGFKVPRHAWFVEGFDGIGMTASAKVQKSRLIEHALRLIATEDA
jgi:fatty-acyl-CoA synthase